jgi:hypothetical protein
LRNTPEDTVSLKEGSDVIGADGEPMGSVDELLVDESSHQATHFVISSGTLPRKEKLIPIHWVKSIEEDQVHLVVTSELLDRLPDYLP